MKVSKDSPIIAFKAFHTDLTCNGFQYEVGKSYHHKGPVELCKRGFHASPDFRSVFVWYTSKFNQRYAKVALWGTVLKKDDEDSLIFPLKGAKYCASDIKILEEIPLWKLIEMCNMGEGNSGFFNLGYGNSGDGNIGNLNMGSCNIGDENQGSFNLGGGNIGRFNIGCVNSGCNNIGDNNTGSYNIGNFNSGHFNLGSHNTGWFNTESWSDYRWFDKPVKKVLPEVQLKGLIGGMQLSFVHGSGGVIHRTEGGAIKVPVVSFPSPSTESWNWHLYVARWFNMPNFDEVKYKHIIKKFVQSYTRKRKRAKIELPKDIGAVLKMKRDM